MILLAVTTTLALTGVLTCGYLLGRTHATRLAQRRRGGMLHPATPRQIVDRWDFPQAPRVYDQAEEMRASVGHPLIPDPGVRMMDAAILSVQDAMTRDPHSRKVGP